MVSAFLGLNRGLGGRFFRPFYTISDRFGGVPFSDRSDLIGNGLYCLGGLCCFVPQ